MNALSLFNPTFANDVFDAFDRGYGLLTPLSESGSVPAFMTTPRVDVRETDGAYVMEMDLPGLTGDDVELNLKERVLTISSVKDTKKEEKKKDGGVEYLIRERREYSFNRRFTLPEDIDAEKVTADVKNGVLTVNIPRKPEAQPRQIQVKTA